MKFKYLNNMIVKYILMHKNEYMFLNVNKVGGDPLCLSEFYFLLPRSMYQSQHYRLYSAFSLLSGSIHEHL